MSQPKTRVGVIYGGRSTEHSISCISAGAVMSHLDQQRFEIIPIGITPEGTWVVGTTNTFELTAHGEKLPHVIEREELNLSLNPLRRGRLTYAESGKEYATVDVVMPILHGPYGEDGTVQGVLEIAGLPYVGPGVLSSSAGMDKEYTKKLMEAEGLPVAPGAIVSSSRPLSSSKREELGLPLFVKPARGGSSIGITKVNEAPELDAAIAFAQKYDDKVVVESMVHGIEVEVGVVEFPDGRVQATVPAQLNGTEDSDEGFYGFETKYLDNTVTATIPADLPEEIIRQLQDMAVTTFNALSCKGLARVDFFVTKSGPVLNEINTLPGFTPISMFPQVCAASGIPYDDLLTLLVETALTQA